MTRTILTLGGGGFSMSDDGSSLLDDHVALLWRDGALVDVVSEKKGGQAFRVTRDGDAAVETPLPTRYLG